MIEYVFFKFCNRRRNNEVVKRVAVRKRLMIELFKFDVICKRHGFQSLAIVERVSTDRLYVFGNVNILQAAAIPEGVIRNADRTFGKNDGFKRVAVRERKAVSLGARRSAVGLTDEICLTDFKRCLAALLERYRF